MMMQSLPLFENPAPDGGVLESLRTSDGLLLRALRFTPQGPSLGTILIAVGRAETAEKYFETVRELLSRQLHVVVFDWRGQGASARQLSDRDKGHIADFADYQRDLDAVIEQVLTPHCPQPWFALGHSMGGAIFLAHAHQGASPFARMVLCAPMIDLVLSFPNLARWAAYLFNGMGLGESYVPTGGRLHVAAKGFDNNPLTTDRTRFERMAAILACNPQLSIGDPTIGWVRAAFQLMARFADPAYARAIETQMLIFAPQDDWVTDSFAAERFCARLKKGKLIWMPGSRHEILMEQDSIRARFWAAFDAFIPDHTPQA